MGKTECGTPEEAPATRARPDAYPRGEAPEALDFERTEARTQNARLEAAIVVLKTKVADLGRECRADREDQADRTRARKGRLEQLGSMRLTTIANRALTARILTE
jgi:hypothetical protein